jgi:hypothetical protein
MNDTEEYVLIAPYGLSCGHCQAYLSKDNPALMKDLIVRLSKENPAITEDLITWSANRDTLSCDHFLVHLLIFLRHPRKISTASQ